MGLGSFGTARLVDRAGFVWFTGLDATISGLPRQDGLLGLGEV